MGMGEFPSVDLRNLTAQTPKFREGSGYVNLGAGGIGEIADGLN
jgi:hypothetical protein